jgi:diaminopimelate epimerase
LSIRIGDNLLMRARFSKMQGAGNDFVVFDAIRQTIPVARVDWCRLADRHFGIGADQILIVESAEDTRHDFRFRIFNADGCEVEQCGNGARCFVRFVHEQGLSAKSRLIVETRAGLIAPELVEGGEVVVNMGPPQFDFAADGFLALSALSPGALSRHGRIQSLQIQSLLAGLPPGPATAGLVASGSEAMATAFGAKLDLLSMGNPHAVLWLHRPAQDALVEGLGQALSRHPAFAQGANLGFAYLDRQTSVLHLRVYERGVGETLACGSGTCAAAALTIERAWTESPLHIHARGGKLRIDWAGGDAPLYLQGPAQTVFSGEIELPLR